MTTTAKTTYTATLPNSEQVTITTKRAIRWATVARFEGETEWRHFGWSVAQDHKAAVKAGCSTNPYAAEYDAVPAMPEHAAEVEAEPTPVAEAEPLHYARTWSAARRHLQRPDDADKTLCGGQVMLSDQYVDDDGKTVDVALENLFMEVNERKPDCARCFQSARKRGYTLPAEPAAEVAPARREVVDGLDGASRPMIRLVDPCGCKWLPDGSARVSVCAACLRAACIDQAAAEAEPAAEPLAQMGDERLAYAFGIAVADLAALDGEALAKAARRLSAMWCELRSRHVYLRKIGR